MSESELQANVRRALAIAREAMEQDASDVRARGLGTCAPDSAAVATLAAELLISNVIVTAAVERERVAPPRSPDEISPSLRELANVVERLGHRVDTQAEAAADVRAAASDRRTG